MHVEVLDFVAGARAARGLAIVIDVFRAFSFAAHAVERDARVIPVAGSDEALALRARHPDWLLAGERHARRLEGFDFGNSPAQIAAAPLAGRTLVHTTHAGTQGLTAAVGADEVLTGALVNAQALVRYARARRPERVSIVRMGHEARERCEEDDACAELLVARLAGRAYDAGGLCERLRRAPAAAKFFDPAATWVPERDFELCTEVDRFDFVVRLAPPDAEGLRALERIAACARRRRSRRSCSTSGTCWSRPTTTRSSRSWPRTARGSGRSTRSAPRSTWTPTRRVCLLSNMGEVHWTHLVALLDVPGIAVDALPSYAVRCLKPAAAIYARAEARFGLVPARTVFVDDRADNVAAARARGWHAVRHVDPGATLAALARLGLPVHDMGAGG